MPTKSNAYGRNLATSCPVDVACSPLERLGIEPAVDFRWWSHECRVLMLQTVPTKSTASRISRSALFLVSGFRLRVKLRRTAIALAEAVSRTVEPDGGAGPRQTKVRDGLRKSPLSSVRESAPSQPSITRA